MAFEVESQAGHGAYIHRGEGAIRIATKLIQRLLTLEDLPGEGMGPDLRRYLQRDDVREVANKIMVDGAATSKQTDGQEGSSNNVATTGSLILTDLTFCVLTRSCLGQWLTLLLLGMLVPTVNIGTIRGGVKVNMIPSYCVFEADIRLPIGMTKESVLEKIDQILKDFPGASYVVQEAATNPATSSPHGHELIGLIQSHADNIRGKRPLPISSLGATDCKHFRRNGVPAYAFGVSPETMAEKDERVSVEEFLHIVKVHTLVALDYVGALDSGAL
jgi:acetylornithine deacetylase/succinyl-diaminopimelate desuccinylase-like protein